MLPVYVGANQHLAAVEVFRQPPRGFVGLPWIDRRAFWKALHHVVEHHTAVLVVEELRVQEIIVRRQAYHAFYLRILRTKRQACCSGKKGCLISTPLQGKEAFNG